MRNQLSEMNYCTNCGKQIDHYSSECDECTSRPTLKSRPFAYPVDTQRDLSIYQTRPLDQSPLKGEMQPFHSPQSIHNLVGCPYCGGAVGITPRSTISTGGFVYMGIMFTFMCITFMIFFPCALIPFGLIFFGLLFKETHFTCINCGQKAS